MPQQFCKLAKCFCSHGVYLDEAAPDSDDGFQFADCSFAFDYGEAFNGSG